MSEANRTIAAIIMWVLVIWGGFSSNGLLAFVGIAVGLTYLMLMHKAK